MILRVKFQQQKKASVLVKALHLISALKTLPCWSGQAGHWLLLVEELVLLLLLVAGTRAVAQWSTDRWPC